MRERDLKQTLISCIVGGVIAIILCMTIPGIIAGWEMFIYFILYWALSAFATRECLDLVDYLREGGL